MHKGRCKEGDMQERTISFPGFIVAVGAIIFGLAAYYRMPAESPSARKEAFSDVPDQAAVKRWDEQAAIIRDQKEKERVQHAASAEPLTGVFRSAFIANSTETCFNLKPDLGAIWRAFCACAAEKAASKLSLAEAMASNESARKEDAITQAGQACIDEIKKTKVP